MMRGTNKMLKKIFCGLLSTVAFLGYASVVSAGMIGISAIEIRSSIPTWLQISEVVATETGTGNDLALVSAGATAVGSSSWPSSSPAFAIDGIAPNAFNQIFHSLSNGGAEFLRVTLASPSELDAITLFGRTDCCSNRDIYDITLFDVSGNTLFSATDLNATGSGHLVTVSLPNSAPVPEPSTMLLFGTGILGLIGYARRRKTLAV